MLVWVSALWIAMNGVCLDLLERVCDDVWCDVLMVWWCVCNGDSDRWLKAGR